MDIYKLSFLIFCLVSFNLSHAKENSSYIHYQNLRIHYLKKGSGEKTILFVHGFPLEASAWRCQMDYFSKQYTVIAIDLPGFGLSPPLTKTSASLSKQYSEIISGILKQLKINEVIYIGSSLGGHIGIQFAADHPEQLTQLILMNTSPKFANSSDWNDGLSQKRLQRIIRDIEIKPLRVTAEDSTEAATQENCEIPKAINATRWPFTKMAMLAGKDSLLMFYTKIANEDLRPLLTKITVPTLIMTGMLDKEITPNAGIYMRTKISKSQLVELNGVDRFMFATNVGLVNRIIENFINPQCHLCEYGTWKMQDIANLKRKG